MSWTNFIPLLAWSLLFFPCMAWCHRIAFIPVNEPLTERQEAYNEEAVEESSSNAATVYWVGNIVYLAIGAVLCGRN